MINDLREWAAFVAAQDTPELADESLLSKMKSALNQPVQANKRKVVSKPDSSPSSSSKSARRRLFLPQDVSICGPLVPHWYCLRCPAVGLVLLTSCTRIV